MNVFFCFSFGVSFVTLGVGSLSLLWVLTVLIELSQTVWPLRIVFVRVLGLLGCCGYCKSATVLLDFLKLFAALRIVFVRLFL